MCCSALRCIMILTLSLLAVPLATEAQPAGKVPRIGVMGLSFWPPFDTFRAGLRELGYVEGENIIVEYRWSEGENERFQAFVAEFIRANLALKNRLPAAYVHRDHCEAGGLLCYAANYHALFRCAATYVDKILKGAKPRDLPVEQLMKFDLIINLKTAKAMGITMPPSLLLLADEVIQ
jgi:hypothetical protein